MRPSRRDNPVTRVSITLSTESQQSRPSPGIRCAARLLTAFSNIRKKSPGSALWDRVGSLPRIRQLCAKGPTRRSHQRTRRRRDERPVINPPTCDRPTRTKSSGNSLPGQPRRTLSPKCQQPSHQSVSTLSETLQLQVRHSARERGYGLCAGYTRKKRT